jgi:hypothetical protein
MSSECPHVKASSLLSPTLLAGFIRTQTERDAELARLLRGLLKEQREDRVTVQTRRVKQTEEEEERREIRGVIRTSVRRVVWRREKTTKRKLMRTRSLPALRAVQTRA